MFFVGKGPNSRSVLGLALVLFPWISSLMMGCGGGNSKGAQEGQRTFGGMVYQVVEDGGLTGTDLGLQGSGTILFRDPLGEVRGEKSVALDLTLEDGGSLGLVTYGDTSLKNGVTVTLTRSGATLSATLGVGTQKTDARVLGAVDAGGRIELDIDVHNGETPVHVLIWSRSVGSYTSSTALFDSESGPQSIQGQGTAPFWGITLVKGSLFKAQVTDGKFAD